MNKVKVAVIIRTIAFVLSIINQILVVLGYSPIPLGEAELNEVAVQLDMLVSTILTIATGIWVWWKDNDFTKRAIENKEFLRQNNRL